MTDREKMVERMAEIINSSFGVDAAYFGVDPWALADYLIDNGVTIREKGYWLTWEEKFPGTDADIAKRLGVFCSVCEMHADNRSNSCPECGADMREKGDSND